MRKLLEEILAMLKEIYAFMLSKKEEPLEPPFEPLPEEPTDPEDDKDEEEPETEEPTLEKPIVYEIVFNSSTLLKWLPVEDASRYEIRLRPMGGSSFIAPQYSTEPKYLNTNSSAGYHVEYQITAHLNGGGRKSVGLIEVKVPELPEILSPQPFQMKYPPMLNKPQ